MRILSCTSASPPRWQDVPRRRLGRMAGTVEMAAMARREGVASCLSARWASRSGHRRSRAPRRNCGSLARIRMATGGSRWPNCSMMRRGFFAVLDRGKDGEIDPDDITYYENVMVPEIRVMTGGRGPRMEGSERGRGGRGGGDGRGGPGGAGPGGGGAGGQGMQFGRGDGKKSGAVVHERLGAARFRILRPARTGRLRRCEPQPGHRSG